MALYVGLDVSLKTTSICVVGADRSAIWEGKAESEQTAIVKALLRCRGEIALVGIEACPLSEWLYGAWLKADARSCALKRGTRNAFVKTE
jgi:transposase